MNAEGLTTEYKREYIDDIKKTVIAFANTNGGKLYIGIEDDGTASPYYLSSKGIRPEGVYVRQGASTVPATETAILKMIKETDGENYEEIRSLNQGLTFDTLQKEFKDANVKLEETQMKTLHIIGEDGLYSNLGLLVSEQCVHTVKLAVFEGLRRIDMREYPPTAIREALLNSIVHRDYSFSGSTLISIFDNRIEIVTIGGLVKGISQDDILLGVSILRNKNLADMFYRLKLIEAYGTGIPKIIESYEKYSISPKMEITDNAFKITLPNTLN